MRIRRKRNILEDVKREKKLYVFLIFILTFVVVPLFFGNTACLIMLVTKGTKFTIMTGYFIGLFSCLVFVLAFYILEGLHKIIDFVVTRCLELVLIFKGSKLPLDDEELQQLKINDCLQYFVYLKSRLNINFLKYRCYCKLSNEETNKVANQMFRLFRNSFSGFAKYLYEEEVNDVCKFEVHSHCTSFDRNHFKKVNDCVISSKLAQIIEESEKAIFSASAGDELFTIKKDENLIAENVVFVYLTKVRQEHYSVLDLSDKDVFEYVLSFVTINSLDKIDLDYKKFDSKEDALASIIGLVE